MGLCRLMCKIVRKGHNDKMVWDVYMGAWLGVLLG